ncbi:hypothetical protein M9Y10_009040 [Tritrichomonas musculus]|uniref:Uncharacterized protein n=1 Tax=Tritrichomonas musculus TaxID=1915356 RepID=A0ABR2J0K1_9EUKA
MDSSIATSTFTYIAVEDQIHSLWKEMQQIRSSYSETGPIKDWELFRLMEVHNQLDIESTRQQELHLKSLIESLKLSEIHAKPTITGGLKARIQYEERPVFKTRSQSDQNMSYSSGFVDPMYEVNDAISAITQQTSAILIERKREITQTLIILNHKPKLTKEEMELKESLLAELKSINAA